MDTGSILGVLAVFALVALNGFFVAAEFALVKVRVTRIEQLVMEGNALARILQRQTAHLDSYIAATQLGITLASLALGSEVRRDRVIDQSQPIEDRLACSVRVVNQFDAAQSRSAYARPCAAAPIGERVVAHGCKQELVKATSLHRLP